MHSMECNLQKAAEADTRGGDTDEVVVLLGLVTLFRFFVLGEYIQPGSWSSGSRQRSAGSSS